MRRRMRRGDAARIVLGVITALLRRKWEKGCKLPHGLRWLYTRTNSAMIVVFYPAQGLLFVSSYILRLLFCMLNNKRYDRQTYQCMCIHQHEKPSCSDQTVQHHFSDYKHCQPYLRSPTVEAPQHDDVVKSKA
jgi:hypothetical protein